LIEEWLTVGPILIIFEGIFDIGVDNGYHTRLFLALLNFNLDVFNLKNPPNNSEILKIMIIELSINIDILGKVIGPFEQVEIPVVLKENLLPKLPLVKSILRLVVVRVRSLLLVH
jgi:hypothetical protein